MDVKYSNMENEKMIIDKYHLMIKIHKNGLIIRDFEQVYKLLEERRSYLRAKYTGRINLTSEVGNPKCYELILSHIDLELVYELLFDMKDGDGNFHPSVRLRVIQVQLDTFGHSIQNSSVVLITEKYLFDCESFEKYGWKKNRTELLLSIEELIDASFKVYDELIQLRINAEK
jgi:hypothetical protein